MDSEFYTNVDLLFSNGVFKHFQKENLSPDSFYRANRCDIPSDVDEKWSVEEQLKYARQNILNRLGRDKH